jgi:hypothetical protein
MIDDGRSEAEMVVEPVPSCDYYNLITGVMLIIRATAELSAGATASCHDSNSHRVNWQRD